MFIQGNPRSVPPLGRPRPSRGRYTQSNSPEAQRLRVLLQAADIRARGEDIVRNAARMTTAAVIHAATILQQALHDACVRIQCIVKKAANEFASEPESISRFQRFMRGGDRNDDHHKFVALESELRVLKDQMALLLQGQTPPISSGSMHSICELPGISCSAIPEAPTCPPLPTAPPCFAVPVPPPCPAPPGTVPLPAIPNPSDLPFLDDLICSDLSDSDDGGYPGGYIDRAPREEGIPPLSASSRQSIRLLDPTSVNKSSHAKKRSLADQIQTQSKSGLRKTRIDRSPGGTPLKNNEPGSHAFHKEILANALFRKFQNVRAEDSPDKRQIRPQEKQSFKQEPLASGLSSLLEIGEVLDDEWDDKAIAG